MQYFFILGKNPILSKAEIEAVFALQDIRFKITDYSNNILIIETEKEFDVNWLNNRLGGTVKIGKILGKVETLENFEDKFFNLVKFGEGKVYFGFSLYNLGLKTPLKQLSRKLEPVAMEIKRKLREEKNINSRWVTSRDLELSSVIVKKNKLLENGAEICFFAKDSEIIIGQTLAVQLFEEFGARDYARPSRDDVSGMLPPKLARMMVNLAQVKQDALLLDPFCGSGTILQEALLLGYKNIIGCDISNKAVSDTEKNIQWLASKYNLNIEHVEIFKHDVKSINKKIEPESIDAIITEPYLGPAIKGSEGNKQIDLIIKELDNLYLAAFNQFKIILKTGGKIIIVFPIFQIRNQSKRLAAFEKIKEMGFKVLNTDDLIYWRPKQFIWRDIIIFEKV
ncbi:methyltransferase domain-containing protein [Candidatus Falkowbacteria bacterium]|nr:methyltransferase domain-containing protein [Candidatus Falkowbacteria bacterium]